MKIQEIDTPRGRRWLLLDDAFKPVKPVNDYLKFLDYTKRSENTLKTYASHMKVFCEYLQLRNIDIMDLTGSEDAGPLNVLASFLVWLQYPNTVTSENVVYLDTVPRKRSDSTVNSILGTVLLFYDYLARNELATPLDVYRAKVNPQRFKPFLYGLLQKKQVTTQSLFHISTKHPELEYIDPGLYRSILSRCHTWRDKSLVAVMYEGGLRLGEALGLHVSDIEIWNNRIKIVSRHNPENHCNVKNKAEGCTYISTEAMEYISQYFAYERAQYDHDYVFLSLKGPTKGKPMQPDTVEKLFKRIGKDLAVQIHPHMCRHGCATARLEAGWDEASIQKLLRHVSVSSTRIYEHFRDELLLEKSKEYIIDQQGRFGWEDFDGKD